MGTVFWIVIGSATALLVGAGVYSLYALWSLMNCFDVWGRVEDK